MTHTVTVSTLEPPAQLDVSMMQAATFSAEYRWLNNGVAQSLAGYSARMSVGLKRGRPPILTVTSDAGEITIEPDGRTGIVAVTIPAAKTSLLTKSGRYDLLVIDPSGVVTRLAEGAVTLDGAVTPVTVVPAADVGTALVVFGTPADGLVPVWSAANGRFEYGSPADVDVPDVDPPDVDVPVPSPTVDDAGKVVQVGSAGAYELDVPDFYAQRRFATVAHFADNPTDAEGVRGNGGLGVGYVDEGAAVVVGDVAYWISGWCTGGYLPYILRYDLASDTWLSSVKIPAPDGAPVPTYTLIDRLDSGLGSVDSLYSGDYTLDEVLSDGHPISYIGTGSSSGIVGVGQLPKINGHDIVFLKGGLVFNGISWAELLASPSIAMSSIAGLGSGDVNWDQIIIDGSGVRPTRADWLAWLEQCPEGLQQFFLGFASLPDPATLAPTAGWGFEGGYYGAIGSKVYFGGGDSNLYDDGSDSGAWDSGGGRQFMSYDTVSGQFETLAVLPVEHGVDYGFFGVADGRLYVAQTGSNFGGFGYLAVYDPATNEWAVHDIRAALGNLASDWAQGVQVGRFLYWPDISVKLNLDADPTTSAAWVAVPDAPHGPENDAAIALGRDGLIHYFTGSGYAGYPIRHAIHATLDPSTDMWTAITDDVPPIFGGVAVDRGYFSAAQNPSGEWRFIGGGTDVQGEVHQVDPVVLQHPYQGDLATVAQRLAAIENAAIRRGWAIIAQPANGLIPSRPFELEFNGLQQLQAFEVEIDWEPTQSMEQEIYFVLQHTGGVRLAGKRLDISVEIATPDGGVTDFGVNGFEITSGNYDDSGNFVPSDVLRLTIASIVTNTYTTSDPADVVTPSSYFPSGWHLPVLGQYKFRFNIALHLS